MIHFSGNWHLKKKLKPDSNITYVFLSLEICLNIFANQRKEESLATPFFAKHTYRLELHLELNCQNSFHLDQSLSLLYARCAPFRAWKFSQAPRSAISSTCKEIMRDKCCGSARLALFTASLTKKCVVRNCALGKWQSLHNETSVTRSILNSSKSNSYIWSLVEPAPEGTSSMHSSWWEHRGACAGCRSAESHLFIEGGFVCEC